MGEDLKRNWAIKFGFLGTLDLHHRKDDLIFHEALLYSATRLPLTYRDPDVNVTCALKADLSGVNKACFKKRTGIDGETYYDVHYLLGYRYPSIDTQAANMKFSLKMESVEIGSVEASYQYAFAWRYGHDHCPVIIMIICGCLHPSAL
ncbi:hypothetical protein BJ170DRAFT_737483 [Xylariales sp. AK1849]|nr:hypothetical protein BJ170DRAFT_737483 [Xylariales sp. AK1849]